MSKVISQEDYVRLVGLLTIAEDHTRILGTIERSVALIVGCPREGNLGDTPYYGHASDAVISGYSADELLSRMDLTVEPDGDDAERRRS